MNSHAKILKEWWKKSETLWLKVLFTFEDRLTRSALDMSKDNTFGIARRMDSSEFVFGIANSIIQEISAFSYTDSKITNRLGAAVKNRFLIFNELYVLSRRAKPQKASGRDALLKVVDKRTGLDLL